MHSAAFTGGATAAPHGMSKFIDPRNHATSLLVSSMIEDFMKDTTHNLTHNKTHNTTLGHEFTGASLLYDISLKVYAHKVNQYHL
jgi:hypothetical protein